MSMKVYTGWKIDTGDMQEVYRLIREIRPWARTYTEKMMDDFIALHDYNAWQERAAKVRHTSQRDPEVDTQFQLCVYPRPGFIFGSVFCEMNSPFYEKWRELPGVKDFSYWNNTDRDEDVSEEEWDERKRWWDEIRMPAMDGFVIDITDPLGPTPKGWRTERDEHY